MWAKKALKSALRKNTTNTQIVGLKNQKSLLRHGHSIAQVAGWTATNDFIHHWVFIKKCFIFLVQQCVSKVAKRQSTATSTILVQWSGRFLMRGTILGPGLFCPSKWEAILLGLKNHLTKARGCKFIVVSFSVPPWKSRSRTMTWGFVLTYCSTFPCTIYFWQ